VPATIGSIPRHAARQIVISFPDRPALLASGDRAMRFVSPRTATYGMMARIVAVTTDSMG
jgi:hypothetical protein